MDSLPDVTMSHGCGWDADQRRPLRTMFVLTSMPIGGAETLLVQLIRGLDRQRVVPELCCLKELGPLGEEMAAEVPAFHRLLRHKFDVRVCQRLTRLFRERSIDAVVTVGCGDKMFWGRLAAWWARIPVTVSALHSTGWPDGVGWLNRQLSMITDAFVAVAPSHGQHLIHGERFPPRKVVVIPNGVDCRRFSPRSSRRNTVRAMLGISADAFVVINVAALRPEKNHTRLLRLVAQLKSRRPDLQAIIVGDGPERPRLTRLATEWQLQRTTHFVGSQTNVPDWLAAADLFLLTSDNEASPVSILEAMACGLPVVASRVGSIGDVVIDGVTGYLADPPRDAAYLQAMQSVAGEPARGIAMGQAGRAQVVQHGSVAGMIDGYTHLIESIYSRKMPRCSPPVASA